MKSFPDALLSRITERNVFLDQAFDFLNKNNMFYNYQSRFRYK